MVILYLEKLLLYLDLSLWCQIYHEQKRIGNESKRHGYVLTPLVHMERRVLVGEDKFAKCCISKSTQEKEGSDHASTTL